MMLRWLQKTGHKPIVLMGGGTTKVGDPSFRAEERPLLTPAQIDANIAGIRQVFASYVTFGEGADRCADGQQCRMAGRPELPRFPARHRPAFQRQPDAVSFESVKSRLDREQSLSASSNSTT